MFVASVQSSLIHSSGCMVTYAIFMSADSWHSVCVFVKISIKIQRTTGDLFPFNFYLGFLTQDPCKKFYSGGQQ